MTIIQSGQSIPLSLSAGQSLVVKDMSGTSSVTGSVTREDAQSRIGQGFFVYGPVASAASVTLTTTGVTDYQIVNGDPTPANQQMLFDPGNPPTSGPTLSGASAGAVQNKVNGGLAEIGWLPTCYNSGESTQVASRVWLVRAPVKDFVAVKVVSINPTAAALTQKFALAVTESAVNLDAPVIGGVAYQQLAPANTQNGFIPATFGGAATPTHNTGFGQGNPEFVAGDFVTIKSIPALDGGNPFLMIAHSNPTGAGIPQVQFAPGTYGSGPLARAAWATQYAPYGVFSSRGMNGVDVVANPASFTTPAESSIIVPFGLVFRTLSGGCTMLLAGDSITRGTGSTDFTDAATPALGMSGWAIKLWGQLPRYGNFGVVNLGIPGAKASVYEAVAKRAITAFQPSHCLYSSGSPNPESASQWPYASLVQMNLTGDMINFCAANRVQLMLSTPTPFDYSAASNAAYATLRSLIASMQGRFPVVDFYTGMGAPGNPDLLAPAFNTDNTHPSQAGNNEMFNRVLPVSLRAFGVTA